MNSKYIVVELEDGLKIVPSNWIIKEFTVARWPQFSTLQKYELAVKQKIPVNNNWPEYVIKNIWYISENYDKAKQKMLEAEISSKINSNIDVTPILKKPKEKRSKITFSPYVSYLSSEGISDLEPSPVVPKVVKNLKPINILKESPLCSKNYQEIQINDEYKENYLKFTSTINEDYTSSFNKIVLRKLLNIDLRLKSVEKLLKKRNEILLQNQRQSNYLEDEVDKSNFPIQTENDLEELEFKLEDDEEYRVSLTKYISRLVESNLHSSAFNILRHILSNNIAANFSWYGKRNKKAFSTLIIANIITEVLWKKFPKSSQAEILYPIKSWLVRAPERIKKK